MILKSYEINRNLKNLVKYNLFLLYGENEGLKKDIRENIKTEINKKETNIELLSLYENDIVENEENFYNSIFSGSLFSNRKIITISNGSDKIIKQIENIIDKFPNNVALIIFGNVLEKKSKLRILFEKNNSTLCVPCYLDNEKDLEYIAINEFKKNNISTSREIINLLIEKSNNDRINLKNEIEKIKSFTLNKKKLEISDLKNLINFSGEYKSDGLINECLCGNISQYKKILSELYTNTINYIFLLRIMNSKIQRLLSMKESQNEFVDLDSLLNTYKPPIFWKDKPIVKKQLRIWKAENLRKIIQEINETELTCKKNPQISKIIFFNFFNRLCREASNYS